MPTKDAIIFLPGPNSTNILAGVSIPVMIGTKIVFLANLSTEFHGGNITDLMQEGPSKGLLDITADKSVLQNPRLKVVILPVGLLSKSG